MAGFIYFRSGDGRPVNVDAARKLGLGYALEQVESRPVNANSPSGKPGSVFFDPQRHEGRTCGYFPGEIVERTDGKIVGTTQVWRRMPRVEGRPELWVGYWTDAKPTPADLIRTPSLPGEVAIKLGDHSWLIPTLTEFDEETKSGECMLPAPLDYDEDGNLFTGKPVGAMGELWDAVHPVALGVCFGSNDAESDIKVPSEDQVRKAAFRIVQANYVVDMPELVMLGALRNDGTFRNVILACCRGKWLLDALDDLKKTNDPSAEGGSDTSAGKAA